MKETREGFLAAHLHVGDMKYRKSNHILPITKTLNNTAAKLLSSLLHQVGTPAVSLSCCFQAAGAT